MSLISEMTRMENMTLVRSMMGMMRFSGKLIIMIKISNLHRKTRAILK